MQGKVKLWPLLTGTIRYEKSISTRNRGHGIFIDAPILAYLVETPNGRILYDVGCDYRKLANPALCTRHFESMRPQVEPPVMTDEQRIPRYLAQLGLKPSDIDLVFIGHLHFDHVGGLHEMAGCEIHVQADELAAAQTGADSSIFVDELENMDQWRIKTGEYQVASGIYAVASPGHTAGHMSLFIELQKGQPVVLCGDAADLNENLVDEIAPGCCWQENEALALESIQKLKTLAQREHAELWPNHDMDFFRRLPRFPASRE